MMVLGFNGMKQVNSQQGRCQSAAAIRGFLLEAEAVCPTRLYRRPGLSLRKAATNTGRRRQSAAERRLHGQPRAGALGAHGSHFSGEMGQVDIQQPKLYAHSKGEVALIESASQLEHAEQLDLRPGVHDTGGGGR